MSVREMDVYVHHIYKIRIYLQFFFPNAFTHRGWHLHYTLSTAVLPLGPPVSSPSVYPHTVICVGSGVFALEALPACVGGNKSPHISLLAFLELTQKSSGSRQPE